VLDGDGEMNSVRYRARADIGCASTRAAVAGATSSSGMIDAGAGDAPVPVAASGPLGVRAARGRFD
jgi:hypothetical protein